MTHTIMGIDPGKNGGIAIKTNDETSVLSMSNKTEMDIWEWMVDQPRPTMCYIEKVHSMPGQGVKSMFSFGQNYGFLRGLLIARGVPFEEVLPNTWQDYMKVKLTTAKKNEIDREVARLPKEKQAKKKKNLEYKLKKQNTYQRAQQLFPDIKVTHAIADALLISEYGWRVTR